MYRELAASGPPISLVAEPLGKIGPFTITNSLVLGLIGTALLVAILVHTRHQLMRERYDRLTVAILWVYEWLLDTVEEIMGDRKRGRRLAPLAIAMFLVIIINNWLGVLPIVGPITWHGQPLLRGLAADLNFTLALAIITMVTAQVWAIRRHGLWGNLSRYLVAPWRDPIGSMQGALELLTEFTRTITLAVRLFGNVFAGEVLLLVMAYLSQWAAPVAVPLFLGLELFVGTIQAYVFFMLTVVFISIGSSNDAETVPAALNA